MSVILFLTVERVESDPKLGYSFGTSFWTTGAFICGSVTSIIAGWIGMKVAVYCNGTVALESKESL